MNSLSLVTRFHDAFEQPIASEPTLTSTAVNELRVKLLREETQELEDALAEGDAVAALDALADLQYVLDGAFLSLGFWPWKDDAVAEVHRSNMTKLGLDYKPIKRADGKVEKGPLYEPPDLAKVLHGSDV